MLSRYFKKHFCFSHVIATIWLQILLYTNGQMKRKEVTIKWWYIIDKNHSEKCQNYKEVYL